MNQSKVKVGALAREPAPPLKFIPQPGDGLGLFQTTQHLGPHGEEGAVLMEAFGGQNHGEGWVRGASKISHCSKKKASTA